MFKSILCLLLAIESLGSALSAPQARAAISLQSGVLLRMHVVAQDDTPQMQQLKLCVRDAVRAAYDEHRPDPTATMRDNALQLLPLLTQTATDAARAQGFEGDVRVTLETLPFGPCPLEGFTLPAGDYPALMIRLGDAQGRNWWGLVDPALALESARIPGCVGEGLSWDWSLRGLVQALLGLPAPEAAHG